MTEVMFHFHVPDRWAYCCRLLRKAWSQGVRVAVVGPEHDLAGVDRLLWESSPVEFLPHCRLPGADPRVLEASSLLLCQSAADAPHDDVLLNLGSGIPAGFERFRRLIEIVGLDEEDRERARERWRHYRARGYAIERHEVAAVAPAS